jgi:hypothetical protein
MKTMNANDYWTATAVVATKTPVKLYGEDDSMYEGCVNELGEKHGAGLFKTAIYISGLVGDDNSHLAKWTEYEGEWCNDLLHGHGVMRNMCNKGVIKIAHDGMWDNGVPVNTITRAVAERLIMSSLITDKEFDFMAMCDNQTRDWCSD